MERLKILETYRVEQGIIRTPGPFDGQKLYVPYFWQKYLDGDAEEVDADAVFFVVHDREREMFPEIGHRRTIRLRSENLSIREA